ncbi:MAG: ligand-binding sensor domain-containing protein [Paraglaciecola sp.]
MKQLHSFWLIILLLLTSHSATAQQFNFKTYSSPEGLGQSQVYSLLEAKNGYLWMGTQGGGVSRFDGQNFQSFTTKDSLLGNFVYALCQRKNGDILIGTNNGLTIYDGVRFQPCFKNKLLEKSINAIIEAEDGKIWLGTSSGLYFIENEQLTNFSKQKKLSSPRIYCLSKSVDGTIWVGSTIGLYEISNGEVNFYNNKNGLPGKEVTAILEDSFGRLWLGIFESGVYEFLDKKTIKLPTKKPLKSTNFWSFAERKSGELWLGSQDAGAFVWQPSDSTFYQLDEQNGLSKNHVRALLEDRWGQVWVGTSGGGVSRYFGQQFVHFDRENGLKEEIVYAVETDNLERVWISEYDQGVSIYDGQNFQHISDSIPFSFVSKAIYAAKNDEIWVATENKGLIVFGKDTIKYVGQRAGLPPAPIRAITEDLNGRILVATAGEGIFRIYPTTSYASGYEIEPFTKKQGLSGIRINDLFVDKENRIWYASRWNGVGYLPPFGEPKSFSTANGLPSREVRTMALDSSGYLWFGTSAGLAKMDITANILKIKKAEDNAKLTYKNIYLLKFDANNNLWIGSQSGVEKAVLDAEGNIQETQFFGRSEGFEGIETCQNAVTQDAAGNLWFGTMNGLTKYVSGASISNTIPPIIRITEVRLFYENLQGTAYKDEFNADSSKNINLDFKPNDNHLAFSFLGINLPNPEKVVYQWKLAGVDKDWSPSSRQNQVTFPNLDPGDYTFLVKAANEDNIWSKPVSFAFSVRPHFWQTTWFKIVLPLFILSIIGLIFKIRLNQIKANARQEKERLETEKHLLELEQKALQLQMNPHFIFNALNTIQSQISEKDHKVARYQLAKFSKLMRAILENSRTSKISLETEITTLKSYLALEQFSCGKTFDFNIITDLEDDDHEIKIPPMLIQPFVENAIIHGVGHLKEKRGIITVTFTQSDNLLTCEIKDNGVGREQAKKFKSQIAEQHRSVAMEVTAQRLQAMAGNDKSLIVNDLKNNGGTEIILKISLL